MGADTSPISWSLRFRRLLRRFGFDRNPMRRGTDRIQAITRAALLVVFLVGAPTTAVWIGYAVYTSGLQGGRAQAAAWHRVPAVVLHKAAVVTAWYRTVPPPEQVSLRWTTPAGSSRTGEMTVFEKVRPGSTISVWIDSRGWLTHPPWSRAQIIGRTAGAAVAAPAALALLLAIVGSVTSLVLDKRRLARWEADWSAVEPQWTGRQ
jgi:hypothetical protein